MDADEPQYAQNLTFLGISSPHFPHFIGGSPPPVTAGRRIPVAVDYAVSPSGKFVLILRNASEGQLRVSMYRLEGLG
jgi:hypothetical protein